VSLRSGLILMLALLFGGSAAVGVNKYVTNNPGGAARDAETVPVVVAVEDIPRGASITARLVKTRDYPKGMQPPGTLAKIEDVLDRAVFIPLVKDEPVLDGKLTPKGSKRGMAALVPSGLRAFTIHMPSVASGVAGFVLPGNKVDVLMTVEGKRGSITTTLLQNLEILAVDQRIDAPADNRVDPGQLRSVTLLVTPDQAARLGLAQNKGALHLSLRNPQDDLVANTSPARLSEFEGYREEVPLKDVAETPKPPLPRVADSIRPSLPLRFVAIYRGVGRVEKHSIGDNAARPVELTSKVEDPMADEAR
jgi:pilus assembly protein CpaB